MKNADIIKISMGFCLCLYHVYINSGVYDSTSIVIHRNFNVDIAIKYSQVRVITTVVGWFANLFQEFTFYSILYNLNLRVH